MFFYSLLLTLLLPLALLRLLWKARRNPDYARRWGERFARQLPPPLPDSLLVHTVSVGEFLALRPLLEYWLQREPGNLWLCCTTPTGSAQIERFRRQHPDRIRHSYLPYDQPGLVKRFLDHVQPRALLLMETELWPNLIVQAEARGLPVLLENARLSARSARRYQRYLGWLLPRIMPPLRINAQNRATAKRFARLGAKTITLTPSLKYYLPPRLAPTLPRPKRFVWLCASTHPGEEALLLDAYQRLDFLCQLILAPRHPERRTEIEALCRRRGLRVNKRSAGEPLDEVFLLDTLGELVDFLALADVAFIGGSLIRHGGHNPLEALQVGTPVFFGPHMFNFAEISAELLTQPFARQIQSAAEIGPTLAALASQKNSESMRAYVQRQENLLARHYAVIKAFCERSVPPTQGAP